MNLHTIFILTLFCAGSTLCLQSEIAINQAASVESVISEKIITNYLEQYFSDVQIVSIIFPSPEKANKHFLDDFISNLFYDPTMEMFACNFLNKLDDSLPENRVFNLILVDHAESLE